jgi:protein-S-isoprenylcysteine O-methyltransferase Ste14
MIPVLLAMLLYALLHSWLAGGLKQVFRTRFGEHIYHGWYRLVFNFIAVASLLPISWLFSAYPGNVVWQFDPAYQPLIMVIQLIGLLGAAVSLLQIDLWRFLGLRQLIAYLQHQPLPLPDEPLQMRGLYAFVRHPLYLFTVMAMFAVPTMTESYLAFCLGASAYFIIGSLLEEQRLITVYGDVYATYRKRVAWLVPFFHKSA